MSRPTSAAAAIAAANDSEGTCGWYSSSCGRVNLAITWEDAACGYHQGDCKPEITEFMQVPYIAQQLADIKPDVAREVAIDSGRNDYGAGDQDNGDHHANLAWILWQACGDLQEGRS